MAAVASSRQQSHTQIKQPPAPASVTSSAASPDFIYGNPFDTPGTTANGAGHANESKPKTDEGDDAVKRHSRANSDPAASRGAITRSDSINRSKLDLEPNPFEQSFSATSKPSESGGITAVIKGGTKDSPASALRRTKSQSPPSSAGIVKTPGTKLPPLATLASPSPAGDLAHGYPWGLDSLRAGPLSPAMLAGPTGTSGSNSSGIPSWFDPNGLRTGLTPLVGGSQVMSPGTQALFAMMTNNTPGAGGMGESGGSKNAPDGNHFETSFANANASIAANAPGINTSTATTKPGAAVSSTAVASNGTSATSVPAPMFATQQVPKPLNPSQRNMIGGTQHLGSTARSNSIANPQSHASFAQQGVTRSGLHPPAMTHAPTVPGQAGLHINRSQTLPPGVVGQGGVVIPSSLTSHPGATANDPSSLAAVAAAAHAAAHHQQPAPAHLQHHPVYAAAAATTNPLYLLSQAQHELSQNDDTGAVMAAAALSNLNAAPGFGGMGPMAGVSGGELNSVVAGPSGVGARNNAHQHAHRMNQLVAQGQQPAQTGGKGKRGSSTSTASSNTNPGAGSKRKKSEGDSSGSGGGGKGASFKEEGGGKKGKKARMASPEDDDDGMDDDDESKYDGMNKSGKPETDEEKRKNFLERNRQAALKCRQRKKAWLQNLQAKVEYLTSDNETLQTTVTSLREEIASLRSILIAHKDCSVAVANGVTGLDGHDHTRTIGTLLTGHPPPGSQPSFVAQVTQPGVRY